MGIDKTPYVLLGVDFGNEEKFKDLLNISEDKFIELEEHLEPNKNLEIVSDGMCSDYLFVGMPLAKDDELKVIDTSRIESNKDIVQREIKSNLGYEVNREDIKMFSFTHVH